MPEMPLCVNKSVAQDMVLPELGAGEVHPAPCTIDIMDHGFHKCMLMDPKTMYLNDFPGIACVSTATHERYPGTENIIEKINYHVISLVA